jgi:YjbE family integral membrane protein
MIDGSLTRELAALLQVVLVDLTMAGDNAVVVGLAVAGLPARQRRPAIVAGIAGATLLRIVLSVATLRLLQIVGLVLAGGLLLLWVAWKMYRELRRRHAPLAAGGAPKTLGQAMAQIMLADLSMSLDNVLGVAGAAHGHTGVLVVGLALSVVLMGLAANWVAGLLERRRSLAWIGLLVVLYVALRMIWDGGHAVIVRALTGPYSP